MKPKSNISKEAYIEEFTTIGNNVIIEDNVYISQGARIYGKALVKTGCFIGENCIIGHPQRNHLKEIIHRKLPMTQYENPEVIISKNCTIRAGAIIYSEVSIGDECQTGHNVLIREKTKIGNNTLIGTNSVIDGYVSIGNYVSIQTGVYIPMHCKIGNNVFMGPFSKLTNDKYMMRKKFDLIGPIIEDKVSLGANSVIFPGVKIRSGTIVGAASTVLKDTNENDIIIGNPGKVLKKVPDEWK